MASDLIEILDKMQFFGGQRAGRELWNDKPKEVQDADIAAFNRDIEILRKAISDAEPVRHGEWRHLGGDEWCCTICGEVIHTEGSWEKPTRKYCHECGAKMDGGKQDAE